MYPKTLLTVHLITLIFLNTTLRPLIRVSEKRVALFIVVSKTLGSFVKLYFDLMHTVIKYFGTCVDMDNICTNDLPLWYEKFYLGYTQTMLISLYVHILALAVNRFIGIYFPFEYKHYMSKRRILIYCFSIWFLSICLSIFYVFSEFRHWIVYLCGLCLITSIGSYLLISIKLLEFKYCRPNIRNLRAEQRDERNPIRISIICFLSLLFGIVYLAIPIFQSNLKQWSELGGMGAKLYFIMIIMVYDFIFCSDELCLFIMIGDLRSHFWHQFKWIYKPLWQFCRPLWQFCCNVFECLFPFCIERWNHRNQNRVFPMNNNNGRVIANNNQSDNLTNNNNNNNNNISNGTIAVLKSKKDEMAITFLFTVISLAYYLTFIVALLTSVPYKRDILCTGTIEGYRCLLNKCGCPSNGSKEGTYWSDCDLFMPWLSGKELGCGRRVYSNVSICLTFGPINYGSKYLCCP